MCENGDNNYEYVYKKWDIKKCRNPLDPPAHWKLKKAFLRAYVGKFPKKRLICLANTYHNMTNLGTRYSPEVENLVSLLASEVPEIKEVRVRKRRKLQEFVPSADTSKVKNIYVSSNIPETLEDRSKNINDVDEIKSKIDGNENVNETKNSPSADAPKVESYDNSEILKTNDDINKNIDDVTQMESKIKENENVTQSKINSSINNLSNLTQPDIGLLLKVRSQPGLRGKLILYEIDGDSIPLYTIKQSLKQIECGFVIMGTNRKIEHKNEYIALSRNEIFATEFAESDQIASEVLSRKVLTSLQETCFTIIVKTNLEGQSIKKLDSQGTECDLGKNVHKKDLDLTADHDLVAFSWAVTKYLEDFISDPRNHNLDFSYEFSSHELKIIRIIAHKLLLRSQSQGKGDNRQLHISKRNKPSQLIQHLKSENFGENDHKQLSNNESSWKLVEQLLACGGETATHKLLRPTKITCSKSM